MILLGAYGSGAKPEISMAYPLTGTLTKESDNIWKLTDASLVSGQRMLRANNKLLKVVGYDNEVYSDKVTGVLLTPANITSTSQVQTINSKYRYI